ncbi:hypothetical protein UFOVP27_132 [uncultured Caudovirales phage]|uniref:Uncharacterized protein n=1 Tax=uncultured Caudovirales phage TaxID=2100421 RepID=A0A6J5KN52_9CAUD|nr:hypothetical protein UFOVP27_132 [uncultured Caudovirales phage]
MKAILGQGQVQASNSLGQNGGFLGAMVGAYAKKKDYETRYAYETSLMEFDDKLKERRQLNSTVHGIVADQARQATAHSYKTAQEEAASKNKLAQIKEGGRQKRLTTTHGQKRGVKTMKEMTAGLETSAGLDLSGGISPLVAGPNQFQGQLQALKGHPHLGVNPAQTAADAPNVTTPDTSNPVTPAAAKGGRSKKVMPFADPTDQKNVKPVPASVASPFSATGGNNPVSAQESDATDINKRASIVPDSSFTPATNAPSVVSEGPKVSIKKTKKA